MIRGRYLTSMEDTTEILALRHRVFVDEQGFSPENERDRFDDMAIYALVYDENNTPSGTGRLYIDDDNHFAIGRVCVLKEARGKEMGDLIMRMLLYRAQELNAPSVHILSQLPVVPFYQKYGFEPYGEIVLDENVPHRLMRASAEAIDIEGSCSRQRSGCAQCDKDCGDCGE